MLCHEKNIKMTDQRKIISEILSNSSDHPDVDEIYKRANIIDSKISIATVYRTLKLFEECGIIEKHDFKDGRAARYEELTDRNKHHHMIDIKTGEVIEFMSLEFDQLKDKIAKEKGYDIVDYRLELYVVKK